VNIVVSDTSPLRAFAQLELLPVLDILFQRIFVPPAVISELAVEVKDVRRFQLSLLQHAEVREPSGLDRVNRLRALGLGPGEAEAIVLADEVRADGLLVDDLEARKIARRSGIRVVGALSVLVAAKRHGLIPAVDPLIERLHREINFRVSDALRRVILAQAGE
jgi:hypothetical protein